jgi:hypothetical protein
VESEFARGASIPVVAFPDDSAAIQDSPRLTLVLAEPETEWKDGSQLAERISQWTKDRGKSPRLYPGSLVWCAKKQGRELRECVELWLAWRRVAREVAEGVLGVEFDRTDRAEVQAKVKDAEETAKDEVWSGYRFVALSDSKSGNGLKVIDLGAGHASASETLCGRIIGALKTEALLNDSVGAGYIDRHWPPALKEAGAWPLTSLRQSFLNGTLTRLVEPDTVLRRKIVEFVDHGDFGLASGTKNGGAYERVWYDEPIGAEEVAFESSVFLLSKTKAQQLKSHPNAPGPETPTEPEPTPHPGPGEGPTPQPGPDGSMRATLRLIGDVPPEVWNRLGTKVLPKLRAGDGLRVGIDFSVTVEPTLAKSIEKEIQLILKELGLDERVRVECV